MSALLPIAAILAASIWPSEAKLTLVSAAAVLVEMLPFAFAGTLAERIFGRMPGVTAYAGCGCAAGPSACSLPAAALTWFTFGPLPAVARVAAAIVVDRFLLHRLGNAGKTRAHAEPDVARELERLVPFAIAAGAGSQIAARADLLHASVPFQIATGAVLGFFTSPCAIGAVALASALRFHAAAAATAFLCVAGIVDFGALTSLNRQAARAKGGAFAYALLSAGLALVAFRHGAQLVRPAFTPLVALCALGAIALAVTNRSERNSSALLAPAIVALGALLAVPPPVYRATETTLAQAFPGERLTFTGRFTQNASAATLVRYAITCCRADASPVVVRLAQTPRLADGMWATARGTIVALPEGPALKVDRLTPVAPPSDPFVYR